jgi:2-desacetyl-2-hydroxyethyl bacteriochlorophyllide A dehydrogenase
MKTLILEAPGRLVLAETPEPGPPGPGEALVRVRRVGICGTDLHAYKGDQPFFTYPRVPGHELGVEVLAVGDRVIRVAPGDRCSVEPYLNCGTCVACRGGKPNCCVSLRVLGVHADGGMRERMIVPAAKLHPSRKLSDDQLALVETLGIGCHAVARAGVASGETVLVVGAGPIGLAVMQFAAEAGATVIAMDTNAARLEFCRRALGVPHALLAGEGDPAARIAELNRGEPPTAVFDATGNPKSMALSFRYPAHGGRLALVGLFQGDLSFSDPDFHRRELTVLACRNSLPAGFGRIIALIEAGRIDTAPWITHRSPLAEAAAGFPRWSDPATGVIKAMVEV